MARGLLLTSQQYLIWDKKTWGCKVLCLLLNRHPQATPCEGQVTQKAELLSISHYPCDRVATQGTRPILTFHTGARPSKNFYPPGYFHIHPCKAPQTVALKTQPPTDPQQGTELKPAWPGPN